MANARENDYLVISSEVNRSMFHQKIGWSQPFCNAGGFRIFVFSKLRPSFKDIYLYIYFISIIAVAMA
jgi:hypothetical protein